MTAAALEPRAARSTPTRRERPERWRRPTCMTPPCGVDHRRRLRCSADSRVHHAWQRHRLAVAVVIAGPSGGGHLVVSDIPRRCSALRRSRLRGPDDHGRQGRGSLWRVSSTPSSRSCSWRWRSTCSSCGPCTRSRSAAAREGVTDHEDVHRVRVGDPGSRPPLRDVHATAAHADFSRGPSTRSVPYIRNRHCARPSRGRFGTEPPSDDGDTRWAPRAVVIGGPHDDHAGDPMTTQPASPDTTTWHSLSTEETLRRQGVDPAAGLTTAEAESRRATYGPNKFADAEKEPGWQAFLRQYRDLMQPSCSGRHPHLFIRQVPTPSCSSPDAVHAAMGRTRRQGGRALPRSRR